MTPPTFLVLSPSPVSAAAFGVAVGRGLRAGLLLLVLFQQFHDFRSAFLFDFGLLCLVNLHTIHFPIFRLFNVFWICSLFDQGGVPPHGLPHVQGKKLTFEAALVLLDKPLCQGVCQAFLQSPGARIGILHVADFVIFTQAFEFFDRPRSERAPQSR